MSTKGCSSTPIYLNEDIIESINDQHLILIPEKEGIKVKEYCESESYDVVFKPSLLEIPKNCKVKINNEQYINNQDILTNNKPLILPNININYEKIKENKAHYEKNKFRYHHTIKKTKYNVTNT